MTDPSPGLRRSGDVVVSHEPPTEEMFARYAVWREYYAPAELEAMREHGATDEWIEENVLDWLERADVWYVLSGTRASLPTMYMDVAANFLVAGQIFAGYLTFVDGEATSGTIFHPEVLLSTRDVLADDNRSALDELARLLGRPASELLPVRYELSDGSGVTGVLDVELSSPLSPA
ncbi:hypothetical protein [Nannocystis punicea]|uniref:PAS domain-containing protein n=1 Tax=Nannocystis punicea TaxID=2995304 RepID=A0ABY7H8V0_9BACT|nr:hypothetical protein [Nannocystis poenicansa]WAS95700.1 hypothetical protein O0S08_06015 [Nannocystis poenicansa]